MTNIRGRTRAGGAACLLMLSGLPVLAASTFCEDLGVLARAGDAEVTLTLPNGPEDRLADCRKTLSLGGGRDVHCSWSFAYRSQAAKDAFEGVIDEVTQCLGPDGSIRNSVYEAQPMRLKRVIC